jgi:uncharacterized protein (TIGR02145 family)
MKTFCVNIIIALLLVFCTNRIQAQTVTDIDGNIYQTVTIGTQVWMRENLKSLYYSDGTVIPKVWSYENSDSLAGIYGMLYSWPSSMKGSASSNSIPSGVQGVCPDGWHLPGSAEWKVLTDYLGGESTAGGKLKEKGTTHWYVPNKGATNETGFTALPGGSCGESGWFYIGIGGFWWSSTNESGYITFLSMINEQIGASQSSQWVASEDIDKPGASVRCLRNAGATQISLVDDYVQFSIYPNPANDWIKIRLENITKMDLSIYRPDGKLMLTRQLNQQETIIDIRDFPEGIYILSVKSSQGIMQKKIIKTYN